ncbi:MAG: PAAR domain-containing protein [Azoarcus sp.]|jgi:uncharacterized Zn-binding protein involved in type VI secretion|nr:PAAR domain-containing protein [Azoarcus sp.]
MGKQRKFIVKGDTTTHGGTVITAWGEDCPETKCYIDGKPVVCVGDLVYCPECRGVFPILQGANYPRVRICGKDQVVEGCETGCGAQVVSIGQSRSTHGSDREEVNPVVAAVLARREAAATAAAAPAVASEDGFCLECWLKIASRHRAVTPEPM